MNIFTNHIYFEKVTFFLEEKPDPNCKRIDPDDIEETLETLWSHYQLIENRYEYVFEFDMVPYS